MKLQTLLFILISMSFVFGQKTEINRQAEQEILKIIEEIDRAFAERDIKVLEKYFAADLVAYTMDGKMKTRAEALEEIHWLFNTRNQSNLVNTGKAEDINVRVSGDTAIVTAKWNDVLNDPKNSAVPTHKDSGRSTFVFEKRGGKWLVAVHHITEADHDKEQTIAELKFAKQLFYKALEKKDKNYLNLHFADDYIYTDATRKGNKAETVAYLTSPEFNFASGTGEDKNYLVLTTDSAIETGTITLNLDSEGKQNTQVIKMTTVWVRRNGRWQIVADHFSPVADK